MKRRPGITLIEVLVAIFIMAIGLLALLTLFPLGALRMSQALQDDRAASCASAGANICDAFGMRNDSNFNTAFTTPARTTDPTTGFQFSQTAQSGGGYPVYVDPYGVVVDPIPIPMNDVTPTLGVNFVTQPTTPTPGISRLAPSVIPPPYSTFNAGPPPFYTPVPGLTANRYFTLLDDMTFLTNGLPDTGGSGFLQRGDRYTWGLMLHRLTPYSSAVTDLSVVVYAGRATALPGGEATYSATGNYQDTQVVLTHNGTPPTIRRGAWILDTSYDPNTSSVHGDFYRVVSVTTIDSTHVNLELQNALSKRISGSPIGITAVTVMDNVVEVFDRGANGSNTWEAHTGP
jgi:prepilin-type N-terminal cleavage/methylation domain-containing protein